MLHPRHGERETHATQLKKGLSVLGPDFNAELCGICKGFGEYRQLYNAGCGMGYYHSDGPCEYCGGTGLKQGDSLAPCSVREQVLTAAERHHSLELTKEPA